MRRRPICDICWIVFRPYMNDPLRRCFGVKCEVHNLFTPATALWLKQPKLRAKEPANIFFVVQLVYFTPKQTYSRHGKWFVVRLFFVFVLLLLLFSLHTHTHTAEGRRTGQHNPLFCSSDVLANTLVFTAQFKWNILGWGGGGVRVRVARNCCDAEQGA